VLASSSIDIRYILLNSIIELGSGTGAVGIAAHQLGGRVTLTDGPCPTSLMTLNVDRAFPFSSLPSQSSLAPPLLPLIRHYAWYGMVTIFRYLPHFAFAP
jgi:hypothetical protein